MRVKQVYERTQVKQRFHSPETQANADEVVRQTEAERAPLAAAVAAAVVPVTHVVKVERVE